MVKAYEFVQVFATRLASEKVFNSPLIVLSGLRINSTTFNFESSKKYKNELSSEINMKSLLSTVNPRMRLTKAGKSSEVVYLLE